MRDIKTLLTPRIRSFYNQGRTVADSGGIYKYILITGLGLGFWLGSLYVCMRVLRYFSSIEEMGDILALKLLSMVTVTIFSLLVFSNILNSLSKLYLAKDLKLVHSMPVESYRIFIARWIETTIDSSWMVILYTLPLFAAYGWIYSRDIFFCITTVISLMLLAAGASEIGSMLVMVAVIIVPASRIRTLFIFLGLSLFIFLYTVLRILRPERLVDPEVFSATLFYFKSMSTPSSPFLPSTWCYDTVSAALKGESITACFHIAVSSTFVIFMGFAVMLIADIAYFKGFSKAQMSAARLFGKEAVFFKVTAVYRLSMVIKSCIPFERLISRPVHALVIKEIRTFFRDQTQWSQLFLIGALVCIYIYNFKVLPLERSPIQTIYLQNMLSFLNMGLAFFVLTAITGRFAFPAISMEGDAIWIIRSCPVGLREFIWIKYFIYLAPLIILTFTLIIGTNILLKVVPFMMVLSCIDTLLIVPGVLSLGIGLGAAFPSFKSENPAQTVTSYGGLLFMIFSALFIGIIIILQAGPVYMILSSQFKSKPLAIFDITWICLSFAVTLAICILATFIPMKFGEKRLGKILFDI